jgi:hypothetical protein
MTGVILGMTAVMLTMTREGRRRVAKPAGMP